MFKDTDDGQTYHDPEAERKAREVTTLKQLQGEEGKILTTNGNVNIKWKDSLQELQEKGEKEFNMFYARQNIIPEIEAQNNILDWHTKQMEKAYEKGREDERKELEELRRNEAIKSVQVPALFPSQR